MYFLEAHKNIFCHSYKQNKKKQKKYIAILIMKKDYYLISKKTLDILIKLFQFMVWNIDNEMLKYAKMYSTLDNISLSAQKRINLLLCQKLFGILVW